MTIGPITCVSFLVLLMIEPMILLCQQNNLATSFQLCRTFQGRNCSQMGPAAMIDILLYVWAVMRWSSEHVSVSLIPMEHNLPCLIEQGDDL